MHLLGQVNTMPSVRQGCEPVDAFFAASQGVDETEANK